MNSAVNFIIESGVSISLLSIIYVSFLRKETFFKLNRFFLLGSVLFSVILPFLRFRVLTPQSTILGEITVTPYQNMIESVTVYSHDFTGSVEHVILSARLLIIVYLVGVILFFSRFLFRMVQLFFLIKKNDVQKHEGFKLVVLEKEISPFSFLNYIFVSRTLQSSTGYDRMIIHEMEHIKQGHSFDVIILEVLTVFQWFNPFMWMLRRAIRENHEFLADRAVLNSGTNPGYYKKLLLNQIVGGQLVIANSFNYSLIKNRIKMMSKIKSSKFAITKVTFGILMAALLVIAFACEKKESVDKTKSPGQKIVLSVGDKQITITGDDALATVKEILRSSNLNVNVTDKADDVTYMKIIKKHNTKIKSSVSPNTLDDGSAIFFIVEEMPEYPGGEDALRSFIADNIKYPAVAKDNGIKGKVYVTFVVTKDGSVANVKIARGVDPALDKEALRVVNSLPKWQPGKQRGKPVNVSFTVPINFVL